MSLMPLDPRRASLLRLMLRRCCGISRARNGVQQVEAQSNQTAGKIIAPLSQQQTRLLLLLSFLLLFLFLLLLLVLAEMMD